MYKKRVKLNTKSQAAMEFLMYKTKSFMPKNSKAQAAMEFLMTYGWALLVVLIAIGALAFFGLLNPSRFLPDKAELGPGLIIQGMSVNETHTTLIVKNGLGRTIRDLEINLTSCENSDSISTKITVLSHF